MKFRPYVVPEYAKGNPLGRVWDLLWEGVSRCCCLMGVHLITGIRYTRRGGRRVKDEEMCGTCFWRRTFGKEQGK